MKKSSCLKFVQTMPLGPKNGSTGGGGGEGGYMLYIDLNRENMNKNFLSETTRPRALVFGM